MYINTYQILIDIFIISNAVKQGGVLFPALNLIYYLYTCV